MTADSPILRAAGGGEAIPAARATRCDCCDLPVESCGVAYARRAGVDLKAIDQAMAQWLSSTSGERVDDYGTDTRAAHGGVDAQAHTDDTYFSDLEIIRRRVGYSWEKPQ